MGRTGVLISLHKESEGNDMRKSYKPILCPECQRRIILMQLDGFIEGRIRIYCRRCKEYFIVTDEGIIANEKTQMRYEDYTDLMR